MTGEQVCDHEWVLTEVVLGTGAELVEQCLRCEAISYTPSQQSKRLRLPEWPQV